MDPTGTRPQNEQFRDDLNAFMGCLSRAHGFDRRTNAMSRGKKIQANSKLLVKRNIFICFKKHKLRLSIGNDVECSFFATEEVVEERIRVQAATYIARKSVN